MRINYTARNYTLTEAQKEIFEDKLEKCVKYLEGVHEIQVIVNHEKYRYNVEIVIRHNGGEIFSSSEKSDITMAIDRVTDKVLTQAKKFRGKITELHHKKSMKLSKLKFYDSEDDEVIKPKIIPTRNFPIKPMSVEEAAMQLEVVDWTFMVFRNSETEMVNVIFIRKDGNFGLIEPEF